RADAQGKRHRCRSRCLERADRARRHTARDFGENPPRGRRSDHLARAQAKIRHADHGAGRQYAGRVQGADRCGSRALDAGDQAARDQGELVDASPPRSFPFGTMLLLAVAGVLYVAMLSTISFSAGGGDAAFGKALASLFATTGLWIALAVLLIAAGIMGEMPRWAAVIAVLLLPLAGVATVTSIDMCSRHIKWALVFPVVLPLLVATSAL